MSLENIKGITPFGNQPEKPGEVQQNKSSILERISLFSAEDKQNMQKTLNSALTNRNSIFGN